MNPQIIFKSIPLAAIAALALSASPLDARDHPGGKGKGGGSHHSAPAQHHSAPSAHRGGGGHQIGHNSPHHSSPHRGNVVVHNHRSGPVISHRGHDRIVRNDRVWHNHYRPGYRGWNVGVAVPTYSYAPYVSGAYAGDSTAADVQEALSDAGYYNGAVDGIVGGGTSSAIAAYQRDNGLAVTASINSQLLQSLGVN